MHTWIGLPSLPQHSKGKGTRHECTQILGEILCDFNRGSDGMLPSWLIIGRSGTSNRPPGWEHGDSVTARSMQSQADVQSAVMNRLWALDASETFNVVRQMFPPNLYGNETNLENIGGFL